LLPYPHKMDVAKSNIIQKMIIDLQYTGQMDGFALQRDIGNWCNRELVARIEYLLDKIDSGKTVSIIDRLVLEINLNRGDDWLQTLLKQIEQQMREKLEGTVPGPDHVAFIRAETPEHHFFESLIFFLEKGYLPWWSPLTSKEEFSTLLSIWVKEKLSGEKKQRLFELLAVPAVRKRMATHFTEEQLISLVHDFYPGQASEIRFLLHDIIDLVRIVDPSRITAAVIKFKELIAEYARNRNPQEALQQVADELFLFIGAEKRTLIKNADPGSIAMKRTIVAAPLLSIMESGKEKNQNIIEEKPPYPVTTGDKPAIIPEETAIEAIYINNAGLIVIAPFLPMFLRKLGLATEEQITDTATAVNLTAWLANGREDMAEFEMVLAKILCGIMPETPVDTTVLFTDEQRTEANELLQSVIEYWNILKDTSPQSLQESFLQRKGKLVFKNEEWHLQVEQQPYDMLLQYLPWNISMIRLPWMKWFLKTEWIY
jgi:hypothetical protein